MTQRSKWTNEQAQEYLASKARLGLQLRQQMTANEWDMWPRQTPLMLSIVIEEAGGYHNKDLDNQVKAIVDSANGIVYPDDRWIDQIQARRERGDRNRVILSVSSL